MNATKICGPRLCSTARRPLSRRGGCPSALGAEFVRRILGRARWNTNWNGIRLFHLHRWRGGVAQKLVSRFERSLTILVRHRMETPPVRLNLQQPWLFGGPVIDQAPTPDGAHSVASPRLASRPTACGLYPAENPRGSLHALKLGLAVSGGRFVNFGLGRTALRTAIRTVPAAGTESGGGRADPSGEPPQRSSKRFKVGPRMAAPRDLDPPRTLTPPEISSIARSVAEPFMVPLMPRLVPRRFVRPDSRQNSGRRFVPTTTRHGSPIGLPEQSGALSPVNRPNENSRAPESPTKLAPPQEITPGILKVVAPGSRPATVLGGSRMATRAAPGLPSAKASHVPRAFWRRLIGGGPDKISFLGAKVASASHLAVAKVQDSQWPLEHVRSPASRQAGRQHRAAGSTFPALEIVHPDAELGGRNSGASSSRRAGRHGLSSEVDSGSRRVGTSPPSLANVERVLNSAAPVLADRVYDFILDRLRRERQRAGR